MSGRFSLLVLILTYVVFGLTLSPMTDLSLFASDTIGDKDAESPSQPEQEDEEKPDPFAVPPNASPAELTDFIASVKKLRGNKMTSMMKSADAVVNAAAALYLHEDASDAQRREAVDEQIAAFGFISRYSPKERDRFAKFLKQLESSDNPEMIAIAAMERFKIRIPSARSASPGEATAMVAELGVFVDEHGFDREMYSVANNLVRYLSYSDSPEIAANLSEQIAKWMEESGDELLVKRAPVMVGTARRLRLSGQFMDVFGKTTEGEEFDWSQYRGTVVLVDFWASWCGPCRAELPNMKRNLEAYRDRGFAIVGINMDRTLEACRSFVEKEELAWTNLVGEQEDASGWAIPIATHYGITAIPTAILVDQAGKVVSLGARGKELDRLLQEMLGEAEKPDAPSIE